MAANRKPDRQEAGDEVADGEGRTQGTTDARPRSAVAELEADYLWDAEVSLAKLERLIAQGSAGQAAELAERMRDAQGLVHEIRDQAGTFGYDLATVIGTSLSDYIDALDEAHAAQLQVIEIHVDALKTVILGRISGQGGDRSKALIAGIETMVAKLAAPEAG